MSLTAQITDEIKDAMRAKDELKLSVLRILKTAFNNLAIEKNKNDLEDSEALEVVMRQAKQRRESIEGFEKAGRTELAEKEKKELEMLQKYLPKQLSDDDIKAKVQEAIQETGASGAADFGKVMKPLMAKVKGQADGKRVQSILKELLK